MWLYDPDEVERASAQFSFSLYKGCEFEEDEIFGTELLEKGVCRLEISELDEEPLVRDVLWFFWSLTGKKGIVECFRSGWGRLAYCIRAEDNAYYMLELYV